jgi:hypothetical protein
MKIDIFKEKADKLRNVMHKIADKNVNLIYQNTRIKKDFDSILKMNEDIKEFYLNTQKEQTTEST